VPKLDRKAIMRRIRHYALTQAVDLSSPHVQREMENLDYDFDTVCDCITKLKVAEMRDKGPSEWRPDATVYAFKTVYEGDRLYVKVQLNPDGLFVLSFKLDGSPR
jgi:hypothetical protein